MDSHQRRPLSYVRIALDGRAEGGRLNRYPHLVQACHGGFDVLPEIAAVVVHLEARLPQPRPPIVRPVSAYSSDGPQAAALDVLGLDPISHECVQRLVPNFIGQTVFYTTQCPAKARIGDVVIRKYEQRRRAEAAEETRRRILDAVYEQLRAAPAEPISIGPDRADGRRRTLDRLRGVRLACGAV